MRAQPKSLRSGFTLAEILLAMLVFSIAITTILALLARSLETADEILLKDEAIQLSSALDVYMSEIPFTEAYDIVKNVGIVSAFQYRGDLIAGARADGTLSPYTLEENSVLGQDYVLTPAIRKLGNTGDESERTGRLFYVRLLESPANPYAVQNGGTGNLPDTPNDPSDFYDSAVLVIFAEFFSVPRTFSSTEFEEFRTRGTANLNDDLQPVFSFNFAVRR